MTMGSLRRYCPNCMHPDAVVYKQPNKNSQHQLVCSHCDDSPHVVVFNKPNKINLYEVVFTARDNPEEFADNRTSPALPGGQ
jgi:transcription elongation factor Elf1